MIMKKIPVLLVLVLITFGCKNAKEQHIEKENLALAEAAQEEDPVKFPVYDFEGLKPLLHQNDGKTYIVNFWATWCKPCVEELPDIEKIFADYKDQDVELILVSLDMPSMWKSKLEPFVEQNNLKGKVVILDDPKMNDWIPKIDADWDGGIPASLIYNADNRVFYAQGFDYNELKSELHKFL